MSGSSRRHGRVTVAALTVAVAVALATAVPDPVPAGAPDAIEPSAYSYLYEGRAVVLSASPHLVAVVSGDASRRVVSTAGLVRHPLSDRKAVTSRAMVVYGLSAGGDRHPTRATADRAIDRAKREGLRVQPVFELGGAVKIPTDEVIVAFAAPTAVSGAKRALRAVRARLGLREVRPLRLDTFLVRIDRPEDGRAFAVSRELAAVPGVRYAEPNFLVVHLDAAPSPRRSGRIPPFDPARLAPLAGPPGEETMTAFAAAPPSWTTLIAESFESAATGWQAGVSPFAPIAVDAIPIMVDSKSHGGSRSAYMTGGGFSGRAPPGPYPPYAFPILVSPLLDLGAFEEAYVELWFWARYQDPVYDPQEGTTLFDFGELVVYDPLTYESEGQKLVVAFTGDLTADPTTVDGWRRALFRVPPRLRRNGVYVVVDLQADGFIGAEGLYVDDIRVVGTRDVDTVPITAGDTYGARQYELHNSGQIAGLGNEANDLNVPEAWARVGVSPGLVVAVIDSGVEPFHPDLNLVIGYDAATGAVGGSPHERGPHGTECAGNIGAIAGNGIGVAGTAPGVKIMPIHQGNSDADAARGIDLAVQHGAHVLSNSWGWVGAPNATIQSAIAAALAANRVVVFAAGNGPDRPPWAYEVAFPGMLTGSMDIITVGASSPTDEHKAAASSDGSFSWGSSYLGPGPDVMAPGPWSYTTDLLGADGSNDGTSSGVESAYTHAFGGTSSATPKVSGIVALMLSANPALTPAQVKAILRETATDIGEPGVDDKTGAGRVDALAAVQAAAGVTTSTTPGGTTTSTLPGGCIADRDCEDGDACTVDVCAAGTCVQDSLPRFERVDCELAKMLAPAPCGDDPVDSRLRRVIEARAYKARKLVGQASRAAKLGRRRALLRSAIGQLEVVDKRVVKAGRKLQVTPSCAGILHGMLQQERLVVGGLSTP